MKIQQINTQVTNNNKIKNNNQSFGIRMILPKGVADDFLFSADKLANTNGNHLIMEKATAFLLKFANDIIADNKKVKLTNETHALVIDRLAVGIKNDKTLFGYIGRVVPNNPDLFPPSQDFIDTLQSIN